MLKLGYFFRKRNKRSYNKTKSLHDKIQWLNNEAFNLNSNICYSEAKISAIFDVLNKSQQAKIKKIMKQYG